VGLLLGASGLQLVNEAVLTQAALFVDIAIGLVLFELGRRLTLVWLRRDPWLAATGVAESALSFACVCAALVWFEVPLLYAAVAAAIAVATSPAVMLLVVQESRAEGQVTERALHLTATNNVLAFTLLAMLLAAVHREYDAGWGISALHPLYLLAGSLLLGYAASVATLALARYLGRQGDRAYVLLLGMVVAAVGAARMLELSVLLALLTFGVLVRHLDRRHDLEAVAFGRVGQLFFVVLFVVSGAAVTRPELMAGAGLALVFVAARFVGKAAGVMSFTYFSNARVGAGGLVTLALLLMSGVPLAMVHGTSHLYPEFGAKLAAIVVAAVLMLELIGPIALQFALRRAGETGDRHEQPGG